MERVKYTSLLILFTVTFLWTAKSLLLHNFPDFTVYYSASKVFLQGGNPYLSQPQFFTTFTYPPFVLIFFIPLSLFPIFIASKIWACMSITSLLISLLLLYKILRIRFFSNKGMLFSFFVFSMFPVHYTLGMGQINLVILLFITLCLYFLNKHKLKLSGLFLGFSIAIKLFPILLPIIFILQKRGKLIIITTTTIISLYLLTYFIVGQKINIYFFQELFPTTLHSWKGDYYNQALSGVVYRFVGDSTLREFFRTFLTFLILLITITFVIIKRKYHFMVLTSLLITTNLLINSFSWQHHFVWTIIPLLSTYVLITHHKLPSFSFYFLFFCYLLISINLKNPLHYPLLIQSHVFFGTFLLWCFIIYLLFKKYDYSTH